MPARLYDRMSDRMENLWTHTQKYTQAHMQVRAPGCGDCEGVHCHPGTTTPLTYLLTIMAHRDGVGAYRLQLTLAGVARRKEGGRRYTVTASHHPCPTSTAATAALHEEVDVASLRLRFLQQRLHAAKYYCVPQPGAHAKSTASQGRVCPRVRAPHTAVCSTYCPPPPVGSSTCPCSAHPSRPADTVLSTQAAHDVPVITGRHAAVTNNCSRGRTDDRRPVRFLAKPALRQQAALELQAFGRESTQLFHGSNDI